MHKHHSGCCGCSTHGIDRRSFFAAIGGTAAGAALLTGCATGAKEGPASAVLTPRVSPSRTTKTLVVQPALTCSIAVRAEKTSWRPWGGLHTEADIAQEMNKINAELENLSKQAEFPVEMRPVVRVSEDGDAAPLVKGDADVMMVYGAAGEIEPLLSADRHNLVFVRHKSGPVYLWYEIAHPRLLRKTVDELGQPGLAPEDVIVDNYDDVLWRLRAFYALKNTIGSKVLCVGGPAGWGAGGQDAPKISVDQWKMDLKNVPYADLSGRIQAVRGNAARAKQAEADADAYLKDRGITLETDKVYVSRAFLLAQVFEELLAEEKAQAITVNECMSTIMPMSETTACLTLSLLNDEGAMAFCESDFVVIPSGILLHHISSLPVFLNDPTYPHHGQITLAHCTAPRRMDGKRLEPARILTHFESDYGAAPKVEMKLGQIMTTVDPDFANKRWLGFRGEVLDNPFLDICRSQIDVSIEGDWKKLAQEMRGFHWMSVYGDHLRETGYALRKMNIGWYNISTGVEIEA